MFQFFNHNEKILKLEGSYNFEIEGVSKTFFMLTSNDGIKRFVPQSKLEYLGSDQYINQKEDIFDETFCHG